VTSSVENSWVPRLDQYSAHIVRRAERSERLDEGRANELDTAKSDAEFAQELKEFVVALSARKPSPEQDSWAGFGKWLRELAADYLVQSETEASERRRTRLFELIGRLESLETRGEEPRFNHCVGVLREQLGRRSSGLRSLGSGVYVGPVWTAAGCPFDTVFVVGMSEGRYPSTGYSDPLLPDLTKREIDPVGAHLKTVERTVEESRQSYSSVISSARQVFMYWPSGIPGESREFGPARWFLDAVRLIADEPLLQAGDLKSGNSKGLSVVRRSEAMSVNAVQAASSVEFDVLAARSWRRTGKEPLAFPLIDSSSSITESVRFESNQNGGSWTEYDGRIATENSASEIRETVGSATAFETYAECPYRYFLSRRLHVEPTESPELELALDALTFGTLIHETLEKFALWRMSDDWGSPSISEQESWIRAAIGRQIAELKQDTPGRSQGAWRIEEARAWLILRQWLRREPTTANLPEMHQVEAEYSFGLGSARSNSEGKDASKSGPPVEVRTPSGQTVKFRGQVDRVDISDDGAHVIVYDYKSGGTSAYSKLDSDPIKRGTKLQLPLYSKAVREKYPDADISASYWFVRESGSNELKPGAEKYRSELAESALVAAVGTIVEGIDKGVFPARPGDGASWGDGGPSYENCMFCEYARVCPKSKALLWESKKESDPALTNYRTLAEDDE